MPALDAPQMRAFSEALVRLGQAFNAAATAAVPRVAADLRKIGDAYRTGLDQMAERRRG